VMAEMFLLQATVESANAIGDGVSELRRQIAANDAGEAQGDSVTDTLQRIADDAVEPYATRFRFFKDLISSND